jgi:hypothetical protein
MVGRHIKQQSQPITHLMKISTHVDFFNGRECSANDVLGITGMNLKDIPAARQAR